MGFKNQVPNIITLLNLLSGTIAVIFAVKGHLELTALWVIIGIFFDFFDGLAARLLQAQSELGLQLDSLADMVTSGVAPGIVMFQLLNRSLSSSTWGTTVPIVSDVSKQPTLEQLFFDFSGISYPIALVGLLITLASAYRLAKFNIDTRQTTSFIGLPTPANTLLIVSLPLILATSPPDLVVQGIENKWFLMGLTLLSCYLLNAEIPLFALKFKTWGFGPNKIRYLFLVLVLVLLVLLQFMAIPCIILCYVLFSFLFKKQLQ